MPLTKSITVCLIACAWAVLGVVVIDSFSIEYPASDDSPSRWGFLMNPVFMSALLVSSALLWLFVVYLAKKRPALVFSLAAVFAPFVGLVVFAILLWIFSLGDINIGDSLISFLLITFGFCYVIWPINLGAALSCYYFSKSHS